MSDENTIHKCMCANCNTETNSTILHTFSERTEIKEAGLWEKSDYVVSRCLGCDTLSFNKISQNSENWDYDEDGKIYYSINKILIYPKISYINDRQKSINDEFGVSSIREFCPHSIYRIFADATASYANYPLLGTLGLRMVIDQICKDKKKSQEIAKATRNQLFEEKIITQTQLDAIEKVYNCSNAAAHEFIELDFKSFKACAKILVHTIRHLYEIPKLIESCPERRRR